MGGDLKKAFQAISNELYLIRLFFKIDECNFHLKSQNGA